MWALPTSRKNDTRWVYPGGAYQRSLWVGTQKKPCHSAEPFDSFALFRLYWGYIVGTWAFFALSDLKANLLVFIEGGIASRLDFRVMDKQVIAAAIRSDKTKSLTRVEPFYCTCTHYYYSFGLFYRPLNYYLSLGYEKYTPERPKNIPLRLLFIPERAAKMQ
jgi:hypothetical protein